MSLTKSHGNMYEFVTHTWNPIRGKCSHNCSYCYMKRYGELNKIHLATKELNTNLGSNKFIFVGSGCDIFAEDIPQNWLVDVFNHCRKFNNKYFFQSKNPMRIYELKDLIPIESSICTTIESNRFYLEIMGNAPHPIARAEWMQSLGMFERYVTIEPILDFDLESMVEIIKMCHPDQVNIGADSGNNKLPEPSEEKTLRLIDKLKEFTTIHNKKNLKRILN